MERRRHRQALRGDALPPSSACLDRFDGGSAPPERTTCRGALWLATAQRDRPSGRQRLAPRRCRVAHRDHRPSLVRLASAISSPRRARRRHRIERIEHAGRMRARSPPRSCARHGVPARSPSVADQAQHRQAGAAPIAGWAHSVCGEPLGLGRPLLLAPRGPREHHAGAASQSGVDPRGLVPGRPRGLVEARRQVGCPCRRTGCPCPGNSATATPPAEAPHAVDARAAGRRATRRGAKLIARWPVEPSFGCTSSRGDHRPGARRRQRSTAFCEVRASP